MDNNVFQILLGASGSGGIQPQVVRFNWSPTGIKVIENEVYISTGSNPSTLVKYNPYNGSVEWARSFFNETGGNAGTIDAIATSPLSSHVEIANSGTSSVYRFQKAGGAVNARTRYTHTFSALGADYYIGSQSYYTTEFFNFGADDWYCNNRVYIYNRQTGAGVYVDDRNYMFNFQNTQSPSFQELAKYTTDIYPVIFESSGQYIYVTKWFKHQLGDSQRWRPSRSALQRITLSNGSLTTLGWFGSDNDESVGKSPIGPPFGCNASSVYTVLQYYTQFGQPAWTNPTAATYRKVGLNGSATWSRNLRKYSSGMGFMILGKKAHYDPQEDAIYAVTTFGTSGVGDWVIKLDSGGNILWERAIGGGVADITTTDDHVYAVGTNTSTDGGYGPGVLWILPKDGSVSGAFGATGWYSVTAGTGWFTEPATNIAPIGTAALGYSTLGAGTASAPTTPAYSSTANSAITNGYPIILS